MFSSEIPRTFWILPKLYELCESCGKNSLQTWQWKSFDDWRTMYLWTCNFAVVISQKSLSIHWYIPQNFQGAFSMSVLFWRSFRTAIASRLLKRALVLDLSTSRYIYVYITHIYKYRFRWIDIYRYIYIYIYIYIYMSIYLAIYPYN